MEAAPAAPLEMPEPDLLLELLIIALDAPAQLRAIDQAIEGVLSANLRMFVGPGIGDACVNSAACALRIAAQMPNGAAF
jgi:hypothetical protein